MRLRNREKTNPVRIIDEENEEDIDDPADDSDGDPEWEEPEERPDGTFSAGLGRKRKSFMPLQMQSEILKIPRTDEPSSSNKSEPGPSSKSSSVPVLKKGRAVSMLIQEMSSPVQSSESSRAIVTLSSTPATVTKPVQSKSLEFSVPKKEPQKAASPGTSKQPARTTSRFTNGDFIKDVTKKGDWIWQVDGMNLLQKFVPSKDPKTGQMLYKSSFVYDGLNSMNCSRFKKVNATVITKIKNEIFVQVMEESKPSKAKLEPVDPVSENIVSSSELDDTKPSDIQIHPVTKETPHIVPHINNSAIANYKNIFKDDFTVFLQALISQCLDSSFLRACYNDQDEYFIEKIKTIDDVLEAKKFSLMSLPTFPNDERILYAIHMYPLVEEHQLPAVKMENLNCVACEENEPVSSNLCLKLTGEPYEKHTLLNVKLLVDIDEDLKVLRVCSSCSKILKLYSKMCHTKYLLYKQCERSVEKLMEKKREKMDASSVIISLLNNEQWCETKLFLLIKDWISVDDLRKQFV